jgi:hypothetical protein
MLDVKKFVGELHDYIGRTISPIVARLRALEERAPERGPEGQRGEPGPAGAQGERGEKGERGEAGERGKDADPINLQDVIAELFVAPEIKTVLALLVAEGVQEGIAKYFAAHPVRDGKDGRDGADGRDGKDGAPGDRGLQGERGEKGLDGKDGAGIADLLIDREGALVATMTDGRMKSLGIVVGRNGENGKDGRDGLSVETFDRTYDPDTHEVVERWMAAGKSRTLRIPQGGIHHGGYWREGTRAKAAETWTHAGVAWIAKRDTSDKPDRGSADWEIFANKGRDGADGKNGRDLSPAPPIKLGG